MIRSLLVVVALLVTVHAGLLLGRVMAVDSLSQSYGLIGIDDSGRTRHWAMNRDKDVSGEVIFLSGDEVAGPGSVGPSYQLFRKVEMPATPLGGRIPDRMTGRLAPGVIREGPTVSGRTSVMLGVGPSTYLSLDIEPDGGVSFVLHSLVPGQRRGMTSLKAKSWRSCLV